MGKTYDNYIDYLIRESIGDYHFYKKMFRRMIPAMIRWYGLPETITSRYIELTLYDDGMIAVYRHRGGFLVATDIIRVTAKNDNKEPTEIEVREGSTNRILQAGEFVIIRNDICANSCRHVSHFFAKKLEGIDKTMAVNLEQLKQPSIVSCPESQVLTVKQIWAQKESGYPVVLVDEGLMDSIKSGVWDLHVQNHIPTLQESKQNIVNECMTYFGVNNVNVLKRERLTSGETEQNNEQIGYNKASMIKPRREACEQINKMFDQNWSVHFDNDFSDFGLLKEEDSDNSDNSDNNKGGNDNG